MTSSCPFCDPDPTRIALETDQFLLIWDGFPVSTGHLLVIPRRHIKNWFNATNEEQTALLKGIQLAREEILRQHSPDGFNIGINVDAAGGQTVFHLHIHVIPRYLGDVPDPRGGVRNVIPSKGNYFRSSVGTKILGEAPHDQPLIHGGSNDPLLPHFLSHLDRAIAADLCVAFVRMGGVMLIQEHLRDLLNRGGSIRFLTGDYLDITEPQALLNLLDLSGNLNLRVFETQDVSFHPKGYLFHFPDGTSTALIGSSNLSASALQQGIEWNYRVLTSADSKGILHVQNTFDQLFQHPATRPVTHEWVKEYTSRRRPAERPKYVVLADKTNEQAPPPNHIQMEALTALENTRREGNAAGLVVLATGMGKTWLSAFDSNRPEFRRILFVAHREEILAQALKTFRRIRPTALLGRYSGSEKMPEADVLFASIQTLGRRRHLDVFDQNRFDYIIVDEFHHAASATYRNLIGHFTPKFLLGLTATPERTDGGDLLGLCQENLVYRCDLTRGIREGLLVPFHYYGVPDEVNYKNIPWRNNRFDEAELTRAVATEKRAQNSLEQYRLRAGKRTIAFCCSQRHCDFMAEFFSRNGCRAVAVHSGENSAPRAASLEALEEGNLDIICAVDIFNEGVDIPNIDTVMMLRPTESAILWMQQFGRGLRKAEGKRFLAVIDYIGNHRTFLNKPRTLLGLPAGDDHIDRALNLLLEGKYELPPGCEVTYELETVDILRGLLRSPSHSDAFQAYYLDFRERHGVRPTAVEMFHDGYTPRALRQSYGSWFQYVKRMGDLGPLHVQAVNALPDFFSEMETTRMTRSFKILTIKSLLDEDSLPGSIEINDLVNAFQRIAERSAKLRHDVGEPLTNKYALTRLLETNPINAWTEGGGPAKKNYFTYSNKIFSARFSIEPGLRSAFQELVRELADWRLAEYLSRNENETPTQEAFTCQVSIADNNPILVLPNRMDNKGVPQGWIECEADGVPIEMDIQETAISVASGKDSTDNVLPKILFAWFGPDAGRPGTNFKVEFQPKKLGYQVQPFGRREQGESLGPILWEKYLREKIPKLFGLTFNQAIWNTGFVTAGKDLVLLVTLEKDDLPDSHGYDDKFLSPNRFQWKSQNRTKQISKHGEMLRDHLKKGLKVHLFVRRSKRIRSVSAPFYYCGNLVFDSWHGEKPITVDWILTSPVPAWLHQLFLVPGGERSAP
jgi:superfamily II DNA or RNA helicase/diadenosine tetraphosphate (Ap4A) HIT family hydrolase